jgi:hypothetical protein
MRKLTAAVLLGASSIALAGCATGFPAQVSRYQAMPAPQGQSFYIVPVEARNLGGLEFSRYADLVARGLAAQGYTAATSPEQATMIVRLGYGVDQGTQRIVEDPFARSRLGWSGAYGPWGYRPSYSRYGYYGPRWGYYSGWDNPYWYGSPFDREISSYIEYQSFVDLDIRRRADNAALFEGRARARSTSDNLGVLVPNLVDALFTGFPGRSGETVRITVPPPGRRA